VLALWLIGLGVEVMWNHPRRSQENGIVERSHGVLASWVEPESCQGPEALQQRVDWAAHIQREKYPACDGQSRAELLERARPYDPAHEERAWDLNRVCDFLARGVWQRRVDRGGYISLYNWNRSVGRAYAGQEVMVRFDATRCGWVILDHLDNEIKFLDTPEISQDRILALDISRKK
jgi:hypothetical protein